MRLTTRIRSALRSRSVLIPLALVVFVVGAPTVAAEANSLVQTHQRQEKAAARAAELTAEMNAYGRQIKDEAARLTQQHLQEQRARADALQADNDAKQAEIDAKQAEIEKLKQQIIAQTAYQPTCTTCGGGGAITIVSYSLAPAPWPNRMSGGQCTWYIANRRYIPWLGNAWQWYGQAQAAGWSTGQAPRAGAIEVAWLSGFGHVAWVETVLDANTWIVTEMHYVGLWTVDRRVVHRGSENLIGFVY